MADKKISQLPGAATVTSGFKLPADNAAGTATNSVTVAQIVGVPHSHDQTYIAVNWLDGDQFTVNNGNLYDAWTSIDAALSGKAGATHVHGNIQVDGRIGTEAGRVLVTTTSGLISTATAIAISQVTNLQSSLDAKRSTATPLAISDTTNLQTSLDGKAAKADVQIFLANGTWTKPAGAKVVEIHSVGGGGGGGGGRFSQGTGTAYGGRGGNGGGRTIMCLPADLLGSTESVFVGGGGPGGAGGNGALNPTGEDGVNGVTGGQTRVGSLWWGAAAGGLGGGGGGTSNSSVGVVGTQNPRSMFVGSAGGGGTLNIGTNAPTATAGAGGGGGGGGYASVNTIPGPGGTGANCSTPYNNAGPTAAGTNAPNVPNTVPLPGSGGGGGNSTISATPGQAGGNGGNWGGGGGGGGAAGSAAAAGQSAGAGGTGGDGICCIITYF